MDEDEDPLIYWPQNEGWETDLESLSGPKPRYRRRGADGAWEYMEMTPDEAEAERASVAGRQG